MALVEQREQPEPPQRSQQSELALAATTLRQLAESFDGAELSKALADFGFAELLAEHPRAAVSALFTAMGAAGAMSGALQDVLRRALAAAATSTPAALSTAAKSIVDDTDTIVLPPIGWPLAGALDGTAVTLRGLLLGHRPARGHGALLAPVASGDDMAWIRLTDWTGEPSSSRPVAGLDPALGMVEITADHRSCETVVAGPTAVLAWDAVVAAGRRALACQIVGAVNTMIELAVEHVRVRVQFGRPVGSFQAVRHRLADAYVAREGAVAAVELAWDADDECLAGMLAKSLAGRAARIAGTQCQQVLAGIGFTAEHAFHRFLVRTTVLDRVLGSAAELPGVIGARLVSAGTIPRLVEL